jgi:antitoxin component YwqK of YwqJK toxin-antitoxin module
MKILLLCIFAIVSLQASGQGAEEGILYVIDSIPVIDDPDDGDGELIEADIETVNVVTNKETIARYGFKDLDKVIFIITKEYIRRPAEVKKIPTVRLMERKDGRWFLGDSPKPYTGPFVDYYLSGRKQGEGFLKDGLVEGVRTVFYENGGTKYGKSFVNGNEHGETKVFFPNGQLREHGSFSNGKQHGVWQVWYSTGQLKQTVKFNEGEPISTKEEDKFYKLVSNGVRLLKEENFPAAAKAFEKAIELNPGYSDIYFYRGTANLYAFKFDEALQDYDRAIELEPLYMEALSNRAFARLRKYEFKDSRMLSKSKGVAVFAGKNRVEIPSEEREKICADLKAGYELGNKKEMIVDAMKSYCE